MDRDRHQTPAEQIENRRALEVLEVTAKRRILKATEVEPTIRAAKLYKDARRLIHNLQKAQEEAGLDMVGFLGLPYKVPVGGILKHQEAPAWAEAILKRQSELLETKDHEIELLKGQIVRTSTLGGR